MQQIKPLKIDELLLNDHYYLSPEDDCYYFKEYVAKAGFENITNSLIFNFKKKLDKKELPEWKYKGQAIREIAELFSETLPAFLNLKKVTFVPIPPSKCKENELYDDRMVKVLELFKATHNGADFRELILAKKDIKAVHEYGEEKRPEIAELQHNLVINKDCQDDLRRAVVLLDDVITTGAHFKACKNLVQKKFPDRKVIGVFIARRSILNDPKEDFADLFD